MDFTEEEQGEAAYLLMLLAKAINPAIKKDETWDLIMELLDHGLTIETVTLYGEFIRATAKDTKEVH
jgi:hypothetical protein